MPIESSAAMIAKEIENLKKNKAPIQKVVLGIRARERLLADIQSFNFNETMGLDDYILQMSDKLQHLRILSLNVVECIMFWREQMLYAENQARTDDNNEPIPIISFLWENENYFLKMKKDTDFLREHSCSQWFNFADKNDPFLVIPS